MYLVLAIAHLHVDLVVMSGEREKGRRRGRDGGRGDNGRERMERGEVMG